MSNGCETGARPTPERAVEEAAAIRYKITAPEFLHKISMLSNLPPCRSLHRRLCYKISGPPNIPYLLG